MPTLAESVVGAALSGVLCSGVTAAAIRLSEPEVYSIRPPLELTVEQRTLVELLADPGAGFRAASNGAALPASENLTALGYLRGWTRRFDAGRTQLDAFVLEFATESGARAYAGGIGGATRLLADPAPFAVSGVPGANGLTDTRRTSDGRYLHLVALHRGARAALLVLRDEASVPGPDLLALAKRQYDALAP
jgi:hypothetical protein